MCWEWLLNESTYRPELAMNRELSIISCSSRIQGVDLLLGILRLSFKSRGHTATKSKVTKTHRSKFVASWLYYAILATMSRCIMWRERWQREGPCRVPQPILFTCSVVEGWAKGRQSSRVGSSQSGWVTLRSYRVIGCVVGPFQTIQCKKVNLCKVDALLTKADFSRSIVMFFLTPHFTLCNTENLSIGLGKWL